MIFDEPFKTLVAFLLSDICKFSILCSSVSSRLNFVGGFDDLFKVLLSWLNVLLS